jgi:antitoxin YefM
MLRARLDQDVKPLSEFRSNVATLVEQVRRTKRPLVLTQRGHSAAVVLDVTEYEQLLEEVETLRDIHLAERQIAQGKGVTRARARQRVLAALRR